ARPQPTATEGDRRAPVLTAAADLPGIAAGQAVTPDRWANSVESRIIALQKTRHDGANGERIYFGAIRADYPDDRMLDGTGPENQAKIEAVAGPQALAASGGICGPVAVDYNVMTIAVADRPVKQGMAQFGATRGGVRYILPHTLAQVSNDGPAAIWTAANDVTLNNPTVKPHAVFSCQAVQEAFVDAVTSIVQFGNFQARYFPEQVQQYLETVDAVHARLGDATLLAAMTAGSTAVKVDNYELGAARDLLAAVDRASAGLRYRHRMAPDTPLRFVYPEWLEDMVRTDLARQLPGDSGGPRERLAVADSEIAQWFAVRDINVAKTLDSPTGAAAFQGFGTQGPGQLLPWPATTSTWLYPEGSWTFLDGGELNLGMVRDSVLNRTNDFQFFSETFEKAIFRGHESLQMDLKLAPTGASAGTVATFPADTGETLGS
ncbi:MAG: major capsid protein, partial [Acidimicrobiales bacterium]